MAALSFKFNRFSTCIVIIYSLTTVRAVVYMHVKGIFLCLYVDKIK